jgi:hypothetical protein
MVLRTSRNINGPNLKDFREKQEFNLFIFSLLTPPD